jgi:bifunctional DNA-binding transcriptional regulator/antitoxin component of YhaV-PrlF toxin-antitoxin module
MKMTLLSSKGQITIPKEMQLMLNIGHRSKLALYPQNNILIIKPLRSSIVEQTAGSLKNHIPQGKRGIPFSQVLAETKQIAAKKLANQK